LLFICTQGARKHERRPADGYKRSLSSFILPFIGRSRHSSNGAIRVVADDRVARTVNNGAERLQISFCSTVRGFQTLYLLVTSALVQFLAPAKEI
jgi:hypothetical protein